MKEVFLVYVVYNDGYGDTEVYSTREKACDAADQLVFEFQQDGYTTADGFENIVFAQEMENDLCYTRLANYRGEVDITVEKKLVR